MKKKFIGGFLIIFPLLFWGVLSPLISTLNSFRAKGLCSCHFISQLPLEICWERHHKNLPRGKQIHTELSWTSSLFFDSATATFKGLDQGCVLEP